jgi:hypothetical protein
MYVISANNLTVMMNNLKGNKNYWKIMLINCNNTEVWTRSVTELILPVAIFILVSIFLQCFHLNHVRH